MKILLDTNAYSDWRRTGRWNAVISTADLVLISVVAVGELRAGFRRGQLQTKNEAGLRRFLEHSVVRITEVTERTTHTYAATKSFLHSAGTPIPENDVWIAATAIEHQAVLVTGESHFSVLPQVAIWQEG